MTETFSPALLKQRLGGRNLYLVGMMGSGKSATGSHLAQKLAYGFVDSDKVIEQACGESIAMIFEKDGEQGFRTVESQVLNAIGQRHSLVVATGGGLVTKTENWGVLHQGVVIWLNPSSETLFTRLKSDPGERPLLKNRSSRSLFETMLKERQKFYVEADLQVTIVDEGPDEVAKLILQTLPSLLNEPEAPSEPQTIAQ